MFTKDHLIVFDDGCSISWKQIHRWSIWNDPARVKSPSLAFSAWTVKGFRCDFRPDTWINAEDVAGASDRRKNTASCYALIHPGWKRAASRMANARQPICIMSLIYFSARLGAAERRKNPFRGMLMSKSARRFIPLININNTLGSFDTCVSRR